MEVKKSLLLHVGLVCLLAAQAATASGGSCACQLGGDGGNNPCACSQLVVRPPPRPRVPFAGPRLVVQRLPGVQQLSPVGDACTLDRTYVSPASNDALRPQCGCQRRGPSSLPQLLSGSGPRTLADETPLGCRHGHPGLTDIQSDAARPRPADAVSVSLAYGQIQQQERAVREEAIAFGPRALPRDGYIRKQPKNVPEEGLLSFSSPVVELRQAPRAGACTAALAEEEALLRAEQEALEAALDEQDVAAPAAHITYSDLGYVPEEERHPTFVREQGCIAINSDSARPSDSYTIPLPPSQPQGQVIVDDYEPVEENREESYGDNDGEDSGETGADTGAFVPVAGRPSCASVLVDRLAQSLGGCGSSHTRY